MRSLKVVAVSFLVAALGVARAGDMEDAAALRAKGRLDDAVVKYRAAASDTSNEAAALGLSETLLRLGRCDEAASVLGPALEKNAKSVPLMLARVRADVEYADAAAKHRTLDPSAATLAVIADARKWLTPALAADPKAIPARILDARLIGHERGPSSNQPQRRLEQVVADAPGDADASFRLGLELFRTGGSASEKSLWAAAEKCFRAAFAADPTNGLALFDAAMCSAWQGRYDTYVEDLERAAALLPDDETPLVRIDSFFAKDATKRIPIYTRLAARNPDAHPVTYHLALALNALGRDDEGQKLLDAERQKHPKSAGITLDLAQFQLAAGRKDAFIATALAAVALCDGPSDLDVYNHLDKILVRTKQLTPDQREKLWSALFAAYPKEVNAPNNAGLCFREQTKDPARSLVWFQRAMAIAPGDSMLMNDVGIACAEMTPPDVVKAEAWYRKAIATKTSGAAYNTGAVLAVDNLADLLEKQRRKNDLLKLGNDLQRSNDARAPSILKRAAAL